MTSERLVRLRSQKDTNHITGLDGDSTRSRSRPTPDADSRNLESTGPAGNSRNAAHTRMRLGESP
jgi:hypothetical protein